MLKEKMLSKLYEEDYPLWVEKNLELLRDRRYEEVDWEHLLEEIEDMGRSDLKECISHLAVVLEHMYKWDHYRSLTKGGEKGGEGWKRSIKNGRSEIEVLFKRYPSLRKKLPLEIEYAWDRAKVRIVRSLGMMGKDIEIKDLPERCPYSYKEAMEREIK